MVRLPLSLIFAVVLTLGAPVALAQHDDHAAHGEHAAHDDHTAHAHHEATFADINPSEMAGSVVNFVLLLGVLFLLLRKSLPEFLANRRAAVVQGMEEAKRLKIEADAKYKEYSERIDNLDAELERLREELRRAGMEERDRIVIEANKKASKMHEEARFLIEQRMKQLRQDLTREAIDAAMKAAEEVLTKGTTQQDQERLAKEYLGTIRTSVAKSADGAKKLGEKSL